jgi:hypothetical protein
MIVSLITRFLYVTPDIDEIWNYQFARRILYGYIPYRDFLMMPTPLSAQINAVILYIFSDELIVHKIMGIMIASFQGIVTFKILRFIGNDILKSFIYVFYSFA